MKAFLITLLSVLGSPPSWSSLHCCSCYQEWTAVKFHIIPPAAPQFPSAGDASWTLPHDMGAVGISVSEHQWAPVSEHQLTGITLGLSLMSQCQSPGQGCSTVQCRPADTDAGLGSSFHLDLGQIPLNAKSLFLLPQLWCTSSDSSSSAGSSKQVIHMPPSPVNCPLGFRGPLAGATGTGWSPPGCTWLLESPSLPALGMGGESHEQAGPQLSLARSPVQQCPPASPLRWLGGPCWGCTTAALALQHRLNHGHRQHRGLGAAPAAGQGHLGLRAGFHSRAHWLFLDQHEALLPASETRLSITELLCKGLVLLGKAGAQSIASTSHQTAPEAFPFPQMGWRSQQPLFLSTKLQKPAQLEYLLSLHQSQL